MGAGTMSIAVLVGIVEQDDFVITREVPGIIRRMLVEADQLASGRVHVPLTRSIEAIVIPVVLALRAFPGVPWRGIAGADDDGVRLGVKGC